MKLSVIVPTLNGRERLQQCLDSLDAILPTSAEIIVVNGPSSDGTTGAVRARDDVDVLIEISERNRNVSRNAGIEAASGEVLAFVGDDYTVEPSWYDAVDNAVASGAEIVTGPAAGHQDRDPNPNLDFDFDPDPDSDSRPESVGERSIVHFDAGNVAFDRTVLEALDGFDEYLDVGGARDCAHRVAALGFEVTWSGEMAASREVGTDGGRPDPQWGQRYRSIAYRLAKNYGVRPSVLFRTGRSAVGDAYASARAVAAGNAKPTGWLTNGSAVVRNAAVGLKDGYSARVADRSARRNPNGVSTRHDRAVQRYDRRLEE